jgi:hypothetical protein
VIGRLVAEAALPRETSVLGLASSTPSLRFSRVSRTVPRLRPRDGTTRTRSAISIARMKLEHPEHGPRAFRAPHRL